MAKAMIIVEAPGKVKTISSYLNGQYDVYASVGHVRDLPDNGMGLDSDLNPLYVDTKPDVIQKLRHASRGRPIVYLMTDADREGEAIAKHLYDALGLTPETYARCSVTEITPASLNQALSNPGKINEYLVKAQEARRVADRLIGYRVSDAVKMYNGAPSAGRCQTVAVRLVVDRQRLINQHNRTPYYELSLGFSSPAPAWTAILDIEPFQQAMFESALAPAPIDNEGKPKKNVMRHIKDRKLIHAIREQMFMHADLVVDDYDTNEKQTKAPPPFITSTLLRFAAGKLKWSSDKTMQLAQKLYEKGFTSYHRSDNPNLGEAAMTATRRHIEAYQTSAHLPRPVLSPIPNTFPQPEGAQAGHEAIRPSDYNKDTSCLDIDEKALYDLIVRRTLASQMVPLEYSITTVKLRSAINVANNPVFFLARGKVVTFKGWQSIIESEQDEENTGAGTAQLLPVLKKGQTVTASEFNVAEKFTRPPPHFTEPTLIAELEKRGIGRPSTYASLLATIKKRYIDQVGNNFEPNALAFKLIDSTVGRFAFLEYRYTADMEKAIDEVERGRTDHKHLLREWNRRLDRELAELAKAMLKHAKRCPKCGQQTLMPFTTRNKLNAWRCATGCDVYFPDINGEPNYDWQPPVKSSYACPVCQKKNRNNFLILAAPKPGNKQRFFYCEDKECSTVIPSVPNSLNTTPIPDIHICPECKSNYLKFSSKSQLWYCNSDTCKTFIPDKANKPDLERWQQEKANRIQCPTPGCNGHLRLSKPDPLKTQKYFCSNRQCKTFLGVLPNGQPDFDDQ